MKCHLATNYLFLHWSWGIKLVIPGLLSICFVNEIYDLINCRAILSYTKGVCLALPVELTPRAHCSWLLAVNTYA